MAWYGLSIVFLICGIGVRNSSGMAVRIFICRKS